ncbi:hypothetical protein [Achromobacter sp. AONIH1]|uniref:hypothetical protein n=1 Tax=Achromobacter sp. AONIH1 TaxID=1758194 RepID=UPI001319C345|nr:hypothetical protein [Achromobacter sp. AONIH1]
MLKSIRQRVDNASLCTIRNIGSARKPTALPVPAPARPDVVALIITKYHFHCSLPFLTRNYRAVFSAWGSAAWRASSFYSARKHNSYRNGSSGVLADMKDNLERIRSWAEVWKEKGD